jgi:hypothetical protein
MRFFISSVISGFEKERQAAVKAVRSLGHEPITAENFSPSPTSPQIACLEGIRKSDAVVLLLGDRYGPVQLSGKSATHEEFEEAKNSKPLFAFIKSPRKAEDAQERLIQEVQAWSTGSFTGNFGSPEDLQPSITSSVHAWIVSAAAGTIDEKELRERAIRGLPEERRGSMSMRGPTLAISIAGGPLQSILRPSELESPARQRDLTQRALFGSPNIFESKEATETEIEENSLLLSQQSSSFRISEDGAIQILRAIPKSEHLQVIIEEDVLGLLDTSLKFVSQVLDTLDPTHKLSHVAIAVSVVESSYAGWRTRVEHQKSPNSITMSRMFNDDEIVVTLKPAHRSRSSLKQQTASIAQDLTVLLRRKFKSK